MIKCEECGGFIESSCICLLAETIGNTLDALGFQKYWIKDIKYDYSDANSSHFVIENVVVNEDIQLKEWFFKVVNKPL